MARETKAQREARLEAERLALVAVAKATYTERMMALLARAVRENFEMTVDADEFKLSDRDSRFRNEYWVAPVWAEVADVQLYELEMAVEDKEQARAEREQRANVRAAALAKLTAEEREELGLL
jgi:hypothetical protein